MRSAGVAMAIGAIAPLASISVAAPDDEPDEAEELRMWAAMREFVGVPFDPPANVSPLELHALGIAVHEAAHAAISIAVGDIVEFVSVSRAAGTGFVTIWPRDSVSFGATVARIAVLRAGAEGYLRATGDVVGAGVSCSSDQEDVEAAIAWLGPDGSTLVLDTADRIVRRVLDDAATWRSVVGLALRLLDEGRIDGGAVECALALPAELRAEVASLVA